MSRSSGRSSTTVSTTTSPTPARSCPGWTRPCSSPALEALRALPADTQAVVVDAFSRALHVTFLAVIPVAAIGFVVVLFLKELPLRESAHIGMEAIGDDLGVASDPIGDPVPVPEPADTDISASHPNKAKG